MRDKECIKHLIVVLQDKLKTIKECVKENEFIEALEELSTLKVNVKDLDKALNKCLQ